MFSFFSDRKWRPNCSTPASYVQESISKHNPKFRYLAWDPPCIFAVSPAKYQDILQFSKRQLSFTLFPIQYSPIVISFYALNSELVTGKNIDRINILYLNLGNKVFNSSCRILQNYATLKTDWSRKRDQNYTAHECNILDDNRTLYLKSPVSMSCDLWTPLKLLTTLLKKINTYMNMNSKMLHLEHSCVWCWNLDASGSR